MLLYHNDAWTVPKLIDSVCNLVISGDEIMIISMISKYFQVWNNIDEKIFKNFCYSLIFCNYFFRNYFLLTFQGDNFIFGIFGNCYFTFCFYFIGKKGFTVFKKVLVSVMSLISILLQKIFFSLPIKLTQRLRRLLQAFPSMLHFVLKSLFPIDGLFIISSLIFLFIKGAWFGRT